jgi:hypothetical protein
VGYPKAKRAKKARTVLNKFNKIIKQIITFKKPFFTLVNLNRIAWSISPDYTENLNSVLSIHTFLTKKYIDSPGMIPQDGDNESFTLIVTILMIFLFIVIIIGWAAEI